MAVLAPGHETAHRNEKHSDLGGGAASEETMGIMEFRFAGKSVTRAGSSASTTPTMAAYLDKEQAVLDAVDAARDALQCGREAQVWVRERADAARVF